MLTREADVDKATDAVRALFSKLSRQGAALAEALAEADSELNRASLKAQALAFQLKLEASRTAASVSMKNQEAEMQGAFAAEMQKSIDAVRSNSGAELNALLAAHRDA